MNNEFDGTIKLPKKKLITIEWIMNKINSDKTFKSFAKEFKKLIEKKISGTFDVYATTYGIGVSIFHNHDKENQIKTIENLLKEKGIKYNLEYSDAFYVLRFKISKSKENIEKINKIIE